VGYAKHIGRVGALAVILGVGVAMASTPAIAYAEPTSPSSSTSDTSSSNTSSSTGKPSARGDAKEGDSADKPRSGEGDGADKPRSGEVDSADKPPSGEGDSADKPRSGEVEGTTEETDTPADDATFDEDAEEGDGADEPTRGGGDDETPHTTSDEDTASADAAAEEDDATVQDLANGNSDDQRGSSGHDVAAPIAPDTSDDVESSVTTGVSRSVLSDVKQPQMSSTDALADTSADVAIDAFTTTATTFTTMAAAAPAASQPRPTLVSVVTDFVTAVLQPFMSPSTGLPFPASLLLGVLSAVRNEIERVLFRRTAPAAPQYTVTQLDPTPNSVLADPTPNVLVIGVDGTNLSRILADDENDNFFALMDDGTTAASSIVGHTTVSGPSWSAILTGVWGERTGVINNVFTPWTYDTWPTVINQLEEHNPDIETTTIADWDVINAISGAGSIPVDTNIYIPQIEGDTDWSETDDAVGDATVDAIENTPDGVPTFVFSYFVGVDENGHMHGGASPEYAEAIRNVDENLGDILAAVEAWETANPDEGEWTIIVVTDHGHQAQQGFGHGFQTPDETATFIIASGPDFNDGWVNPDYEIVDTTPTVLTLFGAQTPAYFDGVSLTTLGGSDVNPGPGNLHQALEDMIATNQPPDFFTNVALSLRTIFATIPYYVWTLNNDGTIPIPILGDVLYVATNIPAQIVAWLTGVTGASIFPLFPPGPPSWPGQDEAITSETAVLACGGGELGSSAAASCDAASVA
jgi:hypothetical protein